jgi:nitric-oxide synthase
VFLKICIQLGWKPQYGLFDVLPLVLQVNGEDPDLYEIPPHLILEVSMEHPQ